MIDWNYSLWTPWAQPCMPLYLTLTLNASFEPLRKEIGSTLFTSVIYFEDKVGTWAFRSDEAAALGNRMLDYLHVPQNQNEFEDELQASTANLEQIIDDVFNAHDMPGTHNVDELVARFRALESAYYRFYVLGAFVEPVQIAAQQRLDPVLLAAALATGIASDSEASDAASTAYASDEETFATGITRDLRYLAARLAETRQTDRVLNDLLHNWPPTSDARDRKMASERASSVMEALAVSTPNLAIDLTEHARRYRWSLNNYARCFAMSASDVVQQIMEHGDTPEMSVAALDEELQVIGRNVSAAQDIKRALAAHLSVFDARTLSLHDLIGVRLLDLRKRLVMQTNGALTEILSELAELLAVPLTNFLYLLPEEVPTYALSPERYQDRIALREQVLLVYRADLSVLDEQTYRWADGFMPMEGSYLGEGETMAYKLLQRLDQRLNLLKHEEPAGTEIAGTTIFYDRTNPIIRGKAVIIRDPAAEALGPGDILVASSTTPDFMGAIRRCSAIVTDWGGQTSHAAITARELGKPCIIGTNFASMVLRTGDQVELDLSKGIIKRITS